MFGRKKKCRARKGKLIVGRKLCDPFDISIALLYAKTGRPVLLINNVIYDIDSRYLDDVLCQIGNYIEARFTE